MPSMNQQEVVDAIVEASRGAGKREVTQLQARFVLQAQRDITLAYLRENLSNTVLLTGFGTFYARRTLAKRFRDVRTRGWREIPAKTVIGLKFKAELRKGL